MASPVKQVSF